MYKNENDKFYKDDRGLAAVLVIGMFIPMFNALILALMLLNILKNIHWENVANKLFTKKLKK